MLPGRARSGVLRWLPPGAVVSSRRTGQARGGRRGDVFPVRLTAEQRAELEAFQAATAGPDALGPWLVWAARIAARSGLLAGGNTGAIVAGSTQPAAVTEPRGNTRAQDCSDGRGRRLSLTSAPGITRPGRRPPAAGSTHAGNPCGCELGVGACERHAVLPARVSAKPRAVLPARAIPPRENRLILDLCAGSGAWSQPYVDAGYRVERIDLPADVRTLRPRRGVWGVLAAPPCQAFSLAANRGPDPASSRDFRAGLEVVSACVRLAVACAPAWWALENPVGYLQRFLGTPRDVWEPYEFGDAWTKRTAVWGEFDLPERGPFVKPTGSAMERDTAAARAVTPPGFARAFFEANP